MKMSEIKLQPCPFCGGEAKFIENFYNQIEMPVYHIICKSCDCIKTALEDETVIEKWNIRKPMDDIVKKLEGKIKALGGANGTDAVQDTAVKEIMWCLDVIRKEGGIDER